MTPPVSGFLPGDEEARLERLRRMSFSEKFAAIQEMNCLEDERQRADIRARFGEISQEEMRMRLGVLRLGPETMQKMFGWVPDPMA